MSKKLYLLVGTEKGAFILVGTPSRTAWEMNGPFFKGAQVQHLMMDTRGEPTLWACVNGRGGASLQFSQNFGSAWQKPPQPPAFDEDSGFSLERTWFVQAGRPDEPNVLFAGVAPAALFKSEDGGLSWAEMIKLTNHNTRVLWQPGVDGLMVHSLCVHPINPDRMLAAINNAGVFATENGGETWTPHNRHVRADFLGKEFPMVGQGVHYLTSHPDRPELLYQQNRCGVYRSDNAGRSWIEIGKGLPSEFGLPLLVHPRNPDMIFVIPEEGPNFRCAVNGEFAIYRSRDRGETWEKLQSGLPPEPAYLNAPRYGLCADGEKTTGFYAATSTGQIFFSKNEGAHWDMIADYMPPILSVRCGAWDE